MKKLASISRELNVKINDLAEFLRLNGFDVKPTPEEQINFQAYDLVKYNIRSFLSDKGKKGSQKQIDENSKNNEHIPLELKIIEAANKEKKLIERIIGFCDFDWNYTVAKYHGVCSQPVQFSLFDEVICGLLLKEEMSAEKIGNILGLDIARDPAEEEILINALKELKGDKMLDGDTSHLWLTEIGKDYAQNGVKFATFERDFELYFDLTAGLIESAKNTLSKVKSEKISVSHPKVDWDLEAIKKLAESQAPEIHFPEKDFLLQSASFKEADIYSAKVWVVLFENFRDNNLRAVVYDEAQNKIISELSDAINLKEEIKQGLLEKLISLDETSIHPTIEEKSQEQIETETVLISSQEAIEQALDNNDIEKVAEITKEIANIKRHFTTLEFEIELKRLFDTTSDELWIISPWVKRAAIKRIPFFEKYMQKGGKIFVGYSDPENPDDVMVLPEAMEKLHMLEHKFPNSFYIHSLPFFHWKNVWLRRKDSADIYYTGSYNILSFFVHQGHQKVRQEEMIRVDWNSDTEQKYSQVAELFGLKYIKSALNEFDKLIDNPPKKIDRIYLQKIQSFEALKLKPFQDKKLIQFNSAYKAFEKKKEDGLKTFRKLFFEQHMDAMSQNIRALSVKPVSSETKKRLKGDFERLRDEFLDLLDLQIRASAISAELDALKEFSHKPNFKTKK